MDGTAPSNYIKVSLLVSACLFVGYTATVHVDMATIQNHPDLRL